MRKNTLNRRAFLGQTMITAGASALGWTEAGKQPEHGPLTATTMRQLGKTGLATTALGMGTGTKAWNKSSAQNRQGREGFIKTLRAALDAGIRYMDMADMYGSHEYVRDAVRESGVDRKQLFYLTKTTAKDAATLRDDLDRFRKELETDYLDVVLLHCLTEPDWPEKMKPCMEVLSEAREKGIVRAHGVSCHSIEALRQAAASEWVQVMLSRFNPFGLIMDASPEDVAGVLRMAHDAGKGMLGMKICAEGKKVAEMESSISWVLKQGCIDAMTIGMVKAEEVPDTIRRFNTAAATVTGV